MITSQKIPSGALRRILDERYGIKMGKVLRRLEGMSNVHVIVNSSVGQISLRWSKKGTLTLNDLDFEGEVTRFLDKAGLSVRCVIASSCGENYVTLSCDVLLVVFRFVPGHYLKIVEPANLQEAGRFLKKLHLAGVGFKSPQRSNRQLSLVGRYQLVAERLANKELPFTKAQFKSWSMLMAKVDRGGLDGLDKKIQLVHGDFNPGNFIFKNDEVSGVFDFEHSGFGHIYWDLGCLLAHWSFFLADWPVTKIFDLVTKAYGLPSKDRHDLANVVGLMSLWLATNIIINYETASNQNYWWAEVKYYERRATQIFKELNLT